MTDITIQEIKESIDENCHYHCFIEADQENISPIDYLVSSFYEYVFKNKMADLSFATHLTCKQKDLLAHTYTEQTITPIINDLAHNEKLPIVFKKIFSSNLSKKEQISLLKGATLTPQQFQILFFEAEIQGYKLNVYQQHNIANQGKTDYPSIAEELSNGEIVKPKNTSWSDNQIKTLIAQSNRFTAKVFIKEDSWHCFYATKKGLCKQEHYAFSHYHYISNKWGISLASFIETFKSGKCKSSSVHINLLGFR